MRGADLVQAMQHEAARLARRPADMAHVEAERAGRALLDAAADYQRFMAAREAWRPIKTKGD